MVLSTLGIFVAALYGQGAGISTRAVAKKVLTFAPFVAFLVALLLIPVHYPGWFAGLLRRLGTTLVPLALVSVGYQIQWSAVRGKLGELTVGLGFKLLIAPAIIAVLFAGLLGARGEGIQITISGGDGAADRAPIVAVDHELDPPLVTLMVGIGIPCVFLRCLCGGSSSNLRGMRPPAPSKHTMAHRLHSAVSFVLQRRARHGHLPLNT
jgi:predicted permease